MRVLLRSAPRNGAPSSFHARLRGGAVSDCFFHAGGSSFEVRAGSPRLPTLPYLTTTPYECRLSKESKESKEIKATKATA